MKKMLNTTLGIFVLFFYHVGPCHGTECYLKDPASGSISYFGTKSVTRSGIACQKWNEDFPHTINWPEEWFPENYCRPVGNVIQCYTVNPAVQMEECDVAECENTECYLKDPVSGIISYFGSKSVTQSGIACQKWNEDFPHTIYWPTETLPENYCRAFVNPKVIECYTVNPAVQMEECDVVECDNIIQTTTTKTTTISEKTDYFDAPVTSEDYTEQKLSETTPLTVKSSETTPTTVKSFETTPPSANSPETTPPTVTLSETTLKTVTSSETTPTTVKSSETTPSSVKSSETTPPSVNSPKTTPPTVTSSETKIKTVTSSETTPTTVKSSETTPSTVNPPKTTLETVKSTETTISTFKTYETTVSTVKHSETTPSNVGLLDLIASTPNIFETTSTAAKSSNSTMESFNFTTSLWTTDSAETLDASVCLLTMYDLLKRQRYWSNYYNGNLSKAEKESIIENEKATIRKELLLDTTVLSSYVRKKSCANDKRYSAKAMGYVGIGVIVTVAGLIVIPDLICCFRWLCTCV